ncbi:MAG: hypothetical protein ACK46D_07550, partial [Roseiflexaceae bacterium]
TMSMLGNWWGTTTDTAIATAITTSGGGAVEFNSYLMSGTDTNPTAMGFQGSGTARGVTTYGAHTGSAGRIAKVMGMVPNGGSVTVSAGTYAEEVSITKPITLAGPNAGVTGNGTRAAEAVLSGGIRINDTTNVTITGLQVQGSNVGGSRGVLLGDTNAVAGPVTISNNIIENWTTGISLAGGATYPWVSDVMVSGNLIRTNTAGIGSTENVANLAVIGNVFSSNAEGIGLGSGLTGLTVTGNEFASSNTAHIASYAAGLMPSYAPLFATNTFGKAVAVSATNGNDGTVQSIYNTISAAITNAMADATLQVRAGTYAENLAVNKPLTIVGVGSGSDATSNTIVAPASGNAIAITANNVTVQGMRVAAASKTAGNNGVYFNSAISTIALSDMVVTNHSYGIEFHNPAVVSGLTLTNMQVVSNTIGLRTATEGAVNTVVISG